MIYNNDLFAAHLAGMIKFPTVSKVNDEGVDAEAFLGFHKYLEETYPLLHQKMEKEIIGLFGLLYHYKSNNASGKLPLMLIAHQDVVPEGDLSMWTYPPYSATVEDGILYGRGTTDSKINIQAYMDALELLFAEGWEPDYDLYLGFGYNEEIMGGPAPAGRLIAEELQRRGVILGCLLDECGGIHYTEDGQPIGEIYFSEKGYADFEFSKTTKGGHSAYALGHSALGDVAKAMCLIEDHPMEQLLTDPVVLMLEAQAPYMDDKELAELCKDVRGNWETLRPIFAQNPGLNALTRTTAAVTMACGSAQANVMPERAWAIVNNRILPGQTLEDCVAHYRSFLPEDIEIRLLKGSNPPAVQSTDSDAYKLLAKIVGEMYPGATLLPQVMCGGTDSRYYCDLCPSGSVYRFTGILYDGRSGGAHSVNEHVALDVLAKNVEFYVNLLTCYGK